MLEDHSTYWDGPWRSLRWSIMTTGMDHINWPIVGMDHNYYTVLPVTDIMSVDINTKEYYAWTNMQFPISGGAPNAGI